MDFSRSLMHCSTIAYFMTAGKERTPRQLWEDACLKRDEWQTKYDALDERRKGMKGGLNILVKLDACKEKADQLALNKDDEPLSQTAKSYLKRYYAYLKYGKWSASLDKGNKYVNKGKLGEPASISLISFIDDRFMEKNTLRIDNEYLTGEPDVIIGEDPLNADYIIDVKTSWDIETFMDCLGKDLTPLYWWQIQGYLALTGAKSGEVSYCLVDTPDVIIEQEKYSLARRMDAVTGIDPEYVAAERELINNMTFNDIPHQERRIKFTVERDDEAIEKIYKRVHKCREYLAEVEGLHMKGIFEAKPSTGEDVEEDEATSILQ